MTIEEKAKAYDEAVNKLRRFMAQGVEPLITRADVQDFFPELAESKDEMIREKLIEFFKDWGKRLSHCWGLSIPDILAWLEKQGEQKLIVDGIPTATNYDKMFQNYKIHKFNVGDFIVNDYCFGKVIEITNDAYLLDTGQGIPFSCEHNAHLWTIKDAKEGDILVNGSNIFIFSHLSDTRAMGYCHINLDDGRFYDDKGKNECFGLIDAVFSPATKEQRDLLFAKMKDAGYEWDADKKELKKIEQKLASPAKTCKNDTLLDLLNKMPSCITVDGIDYHFVMAKPIYISYYAYYKAIGEDGRGNAIFGITAHSPIDLLAEMLEILKEKGLLE